MPPPIYLLAGTLLLTIAVAVVDAARRRRVQSVLRRLAVEKHLHFSPRDQLRLTDRVAAHLPVPGAAHVRVTNLLYGTADGVHRYVFTAEYTVGVVRSKKRVRRAAGFSEPRETRAYAPLAVITLAPADLSLPEQYRALLD